LTQPLELIGSDLLQDRTGVWVLRGHERFNYSDGAASERHLSAALAGAADLSAKSADLEKYIVDWPSEYHLSRKRAQLLAGFEFDRSSRVLEVGAGCGAITRYLGETFDEVLSVEGSLARARLARARTRELMGVQVVCAPFQKIEFTQQFDLIFCIGVFEYSASFVDASDPYDAVLRRFDQLLSPRGTLVLAIENQFGLKYFNRCREDHLGRRYVGLEGYVSEKPKVRTFGREALRHRLCERFRHVEFFYPYPDYKLPNCVINDAFLKAGEAGELVSQMRSRDYLGTAPGLWDEALVSLELSQNALLPHLANSFLVMASNSEDHQYAFPQHCIIFSPERVPAFRTVTRVRPYGSGTVAAKDLASGRSMERGGPFTLVPSLSEWQSGDSLQTTVYRRCKNADLTVEQIFEPCAPWLQMLRDHAVERDCVSYVPGRFVDANWGNYYDGEGGGVLIDQEWRVDREIELSVVVIRAIYVFLNNVRASGPLNRGLSLRSGRRLLRRIAGSIGVSLRAADFDRFVELESEFQSAVYGSSVRQNALLIRWFLYDKSSFNVVWRLSPRVIATARRVRNKLLSTLSTT
jgi:SAM-dependent methyltransferase